MANHEEEHAAIASCSSRTNQRGILRNQRIATVSASPKTLAKNGSKLVPTADNGSSIAKDADMKRDPTDPISGAVLGCYDVVSDIMLGLAAGPIEISKQADPLFHASHTRQDASSRTEERPKSITASSAEFKRIPFAIGKVALGTAKGLGSVVTTSLKSPALIMHGVTRGFHNLPKMYGEEVRVYDSVTGLRSGLLVSAKSFGHGLGDGVRDFATKPVEGAEKNGIVGFSTGLATGIANMALKSAAG
jgi:hypothetical protein